jgi:hypothetical protein
LVRIDEVAAQLGEGERGIQWNGGFHERCVIRNGLKRTEHAILAFVGWLVLLVICWPLALLALVLWPFVWLVSLPFRMVGITFDALFELLKAVLLLPARVLGSKPKA